MVTLFQVDTNGNIILAPNGAGTVQTDNLQLDGNTISSTDTNGDLMLIPNGDGNVGIGTSSPTQKLQVDGYQTFYDSTLLPGRNTTGSDLVPSKIILGNEYSPQIRTFYPDTSYTDGLDLEFWTGGPNTITDNTSSRLTIKAQSGNVGIGTSSPETKLDVAGTLRHQGLTLNEGTTPNVDEVKTFNLNVSYDTTTWTDVGINREDLATGSYIIQLLIDSGSTSVGNRGTYYTGFMTWYGSNNIYGDPPTYNEILLHHAGRYQWAGSVFYLRTYRDGTAGTMSLQIKNATRTFSNVPMTFKFRRMI